MLQLLVALLATLSAVVQAAPAKHGDTQLLLSWQIVTNTTVPEAVIGLVNTTAAQAILGENSTSNYFSDLLLDAIATNDLAVLQQLISTSYIKQNLWNLQDSVLSEQVWESQKLLQKAWVYVAYAHAYVDGYLQTWLSDGVYAAVKSAQAWVGSRVGTLGFERPFEIARFVDCPGFIVEWSDGTDRWYVYVSPQSPKECDTGEITSSVTKRLDHLIQVVESKDYVGWCFREKFDGGWKADV